MGLADPLPTLRLPLAAILPALVLFTRNQVSENPVFAKPHAQCVSSEYGRDRLAAPEHPAPSQ